MLCKVGLISPQGTVLQQSHATFEPGKDSRVAGDGVGYGQKGQFLTSPPKKPVGIWSKSVNGLGVGSVLTFSKGKSCSIRNGG